MFASTSRPNCTRARFASVLVALFAAAVFCAPTWAQSYTGSVTGTITDPSGAVIPNAKLTLLDEQKGFTFTATSDSNGGYVIRQVPPGNYKLSVEAQGFRSESRPGIKLDVSQLQDDNEVVLVAENLGSIPPNTSYLVAVVGNKKYEARLFADEHSSALIRFVRDVKREP